ncbi:36235_t:CDS:1, partial [Racocetra persica]
PPTISQAIELFSNSISSQVSRFSVTLAESDIKKILTSVKFDEEMITSAKSDEEIIVSARSDEKEIQISAKSDIEEMSNIEEIFGVEEMSEIKIYDVEEIMFNTDKVHFTNHEAIEQL